MIATSKLCSKETHYNNIVNKQKAESNVLFGFSKEKMQFGQI